MDQGKDKDDNVGPSDEYYGGPGSGYGYGDVPHDAVWPYNPSAPYNTPAPHHSQPAPSQAFFNSQHYGAPVNTGPVYNGPSTVVVVNQPTSNNPTFRAWTNTLCGSCCSAGPCFCVSSVLCPICALAWFSDHTGENCCVPCCHGPTAFLLVTRTKLRVKHSLGGDMCGDCCPLCCCPLCFVCQTKAEWDLLERNRAV